MTAAVALDAPDLESLVVDNMFLARQLAFEYLSRAPKHTDSDEIVSAAMLGLVEASRRFRPERGVPFPAWATTRIRGAIVDAARGQDPLSRRTRTNVRKLLATEDELTHQLGHSPTEASLTEVTGLDVEVVRKLKQEMHRGIVLSLDEALPDRPDSFAATLVDADPTPLESLEKRELDAYLRDAIDSLPERLREVVEGHFVHGYSNAEVGEKLGVTPQRVSQLRAEALRMLRGGMAAQFDDGEEPPSGPTLPARTVTAQASYAAAIAARRTYTERLSGTM